MVGLAKGRGQTLFRVSLPESLAPLVAEKGSIAVDGVSLTVSSLGRDWFEAALIPHTLAETNLSDRRAGDLVNLEADLLARHLSRLLDMRAEPAGTPAHKRSLVVRGRARRGRGHNGDHQ